MYTTIQRTKKINIKIVENAHHIRCIFINKKLPGCFQFTFYCRSIHLSFFTFSKLTNRSINLIIHFMVKKIFFLTMSEKKTIFTIINKKLKYFTSRSNL
ncbi:hypothetical protein T12_1988 [Trichinella patagoniensis]|uniref:Uncharacterized protein n=1 Tax=Trichinella patagoniensis TaxID=990121 RepID=A0A0V0ZCL2_9BILA|nr:hypothetical protein T12_1988 [Trichinella patagoniensis]